jgi:hypothetical protein
MNKNSNQDSLGGGALPFFAFLLAIVIPPVGAVLGHLALYRIKSGKISSSYRRMALAGVTIGWVLTGLLVLIWRETPGLFELLVRSTFWVYLIR